MTHYLEFENPVAELEGKAAELRSAEAEGKAPASKKDIRDLERKAEKELKELYASLTPWRKCQVARHPNRPHCRDYLTELFTDRVDLAGDRSYSEDTAVIGCLARLNDQPVAVIGQEKGFDTNSRLHHNFGMARPEGYRKAVRLMDLADRFGIPVVMIVDTPGAYPGKGAEERGQSEAIAKTIDKCLSLSVPVVSVIIGEGGSGGAVAFTSADRVAMLEHSIYSVISPEGCASILWKDADKMREAAEALRLTAQDLLQLGIVDRVIPEPLGGAQRDPKSAIESVGSALAEMLGEVSDLKPSERTRTREKRFLDIGAEALAA